MKHDSDASVARARDESEQLPTLPNAAPAHRPASPSPAPENTGSLPGAGRQSQTYGGVRSAAQALRREEAARARVFAVAMVALSGVAMIAEPFVTGVWWMRALTMGSLAGVGANAARIAIVAREPAKYTRSVGRAFAAASLAGLIVLTVRIGVFSPAPILLTLGVAFFALGEDRRLAFGVALAAGAFYAFFALLIATGALPDAGLVPALAVPPEGRTAAIVLVPLAQAVMLYAGRASRRAMLRAIQRSNEWLREARTREAKADEANRDLDNLLKMSASQIAAHSGVSAGKYILGERIGRGAMGEVYAAKHAETGQPAAVKLLHASMQEDALYMQRFLREGEAASKLRAPNVVSIFEVGKLEDGAPYIAMELLRGHDLGWHLRRRAQISLDEVLYIVQQVASGLEAARLAGVVHRDLKPQNLFLAQQMNAAPIWKILDFGVSRLTDSSGTLTKDIIVGTPGYMSPEQAGGLPATHRSDVFSFGAVVYRALTGEPPFSGPDTPQTLYQVVYRNPARPSALAPALPPDVDLVLAIALAKDPADRFTSAIEMSNALTAATKSALDPELRLHGRTLVAALPWGSGARDSFLGEDEIEDADDDLSDSDR